MKEKRENRGGVRRGAGRKSSGIVFKTITLRVPEHMATELRAIAEAQNRPIWRVIAEALHIDTGEK